MKTIYLDSNYLCHSSAVEGLRPVETDMFDSIGSRAIECFRLIPDGEKWIDSKGRTISGPYACIIVSPSVYNVAQAQYEADESARLGELGIPQESDFIATRNYPVGSFVGIDGHIYEVISAIPAHSSIQNRQNVIETTVERYLDALKESE